MMTRDRHLVLAEFQLGSDQALTPEGFLFCRNVPIACARPQQYLAEELPGLEPGRDGIIHVERRPEDVFLEKALRSFEGKDIVGDREAEHPEALVGPHNYKELTVGTVLNPRRGEGALVDFMVADLLIKDADAIAAVREGKREVSCGYDAEYEQIGPGKARQHDIIGNHLALVKRGRCGSQCSIGDHIMAEKKSLFERAMDALRAGGEPAMKAVLSTTDAEMGEHIGGAGGVHIHLNGGPNGSTTMAPTADESEKEKEKMDDAEMPPWFKKHAEDSAKSMASLDAWRKNVDAWMKARDAGPAEEDEDEETAEGEGEGESEGDVMSLDSGDDEDELEKKEAEKMKDRKMKDKKKTKDSAVVAASKQLFRDVISGAEILAPGLKLPTFDAVTGPKLVEQMCVLKRRAIAAHAHTKDGAASIADIIGARTLNLKAMDCASVGLLFNGAVAFAKDRNSRSDIDLGTQQQRRPTSDFKPPASVSDFNATKNAFWARQAKN